MAKTYKSKLILALLSVYLIWGSSFLAIQVMSKTLPPFIGSGIRFLTAGIILTVWKLLEGKGMPSLKHIKTAAISGALLLLLAHGSVIGALQFMPSGMSNVIFSTVPMWMVLLSMLLNNEKESGRMVIPGLIIGIAGIIALLNPFSMDHDLNIFGILWLAAGALLWAAGSLYGGRAESHPSTGLAAGLMMTFGGAYLSIAGLMAGEAGRINLSTVTMESILAFLYLLVFGSIIGFSSFNWLLKNATPAVVGTHTYVNPLVSIVLGVTLAGESLSPFQLLGGVIILTSLFLLTKGKARQRQKVVIKKLSLQEH